MSENAPQYEIAKKRVVYTLPGVDAVTVRRDEEYRVTDAGALTVDCYYPPQSIGGSRTPAVISVTGASDAGAKKMLGCNLKDMGSYISWGELAAASGHRRRLRAAPLLREPPAHDDNDAVLVQFLSGCRWQVDV